MRPIRSPHGGHGRATWSSPTLPAAQTVVCPRCKASPGSTCLELSSWREMPGHPDGGIYVRRIKNSHPQRVTAARKPVTQADPTDRALLREQLRQLGEHKLTAGERMKLRQWANGSRTADELQHRIAELERMGDLPW